MSTEQNSTQTPAYRAAHVPAGQDLGHRWSTRVADHEDPADRRAIRQIAELTFESSAEADLVDELAGGGEGVEVVVGDLVQSFAGGEQHPGHDLRGHG